MKIIYKDKHIVSISEAIQGTIDDASCGGVAENASAKADEAGKILGQLVEYLHNRNLLTNSEINSMLGCRYTIEED